MFVLYSTVTAVTLIWIKKLFATSCIDKLIALLEALIFRLEFGTEGFNLQSKFFNK